MLLISELHTHGMTSPFSLLTMRKIPKEGILVWAQLGNSPNASSTLALLGHSLERGKYYLATS